MSDYRVTKSRLGMTGAENLIWKTSRDVLEVTGRLGIFGSPTAGFSIGLDQSIDMFVMSKLEDHRISTNWQTWLPSLRISALLNLAEDIGNWRFDGTPDEEGAFWPIFYANSDVVRSRVATILNCHGAPAVREVSFPGLVLDPTEISSRVRIAFEGPLFVASCGLGQ